MNNVYQLINSTLSGLGYPVREHGTYAPNVKLPDTFLTYQIIGSPSSSHADNMPTSQTTRVQVTLYSRRPAVKQGADELIRASLIPAGFLRVDGRDLPFQSDTGHYAYTSDYRFYDQL